jgi:hypothetical protein
MRGEEEESPLRASRLESYLSEPEKISSSHSLTVGLEPFELISDVIACVTLDESSLRLAGPLSLQSEVIVPPMARLTIRQSGKSLGAMDHAWKMELPTRSTVLS